MSLGRQLREECPHVWYARRLGDITFYTRCLSVFQIIIQLPTAWRLSDMERKSVSNWLMAVSDISAFGSRSLLIDRHVCFPVQSQLLNLFSMTEVWLYLEAVFRICSHHQLRPICFTRRWGSTLSQHATRSGLFKQAIQAMVSQPGLE